MTDLDKMVEALRFPKITVTDQHGRNDRAGYLTIVSCRMLLIELERRGFVVTPYQQQRNMT